MAGMGGVVFEQGWLGFRMGLGVEMGVVGFSNGCGCRNGHWWVVELVQLLK